LNGNNAGMGSPALAAQPSSFGRFVNAEQAREKRTLEKQEKRRLKGDRKMVKEERKALRRGQLLEEKLRSEDYKMRSSRVDKLQFWYNRYQTRKLGLERELALINAHLDRMRQVIAERNNQAGVGQGQQQTINQTVTTTTTTYPLQPTI